MAVFSAKYLDQLEMAKGLEGFPPCCVDHLVSVTSQHNAVFELVCYPPNIAAVFHAVS